MRPEPLRVAQEAAARKGGAFAGLSLRLPREERAPGRARNRFLLPGGDASGGTKRPMCAGRDSSLCLRVGGSPTVRHVVSSCPTVRNASLPPPSLRVADLPVTLNPGFAPHEWMAHCLQVADGGRPPTMRARERPP